MAFRTGYIPDPAGHRRTPFLHVKGRLAPAPANEYKASLVGALPGVLDQGQTGSCTGHATASGLYTALGLSGSPLPWVPSPAGIYTIGRCVDRSPNADGSLPTLKDDGAQPNQVLRGVNLWGVRPMQPLPDRNSDADPATINAEPNLVQLEEDALELFVGDYAILTYGAGMASDVRQAITNGVPVAVAVPGGDDAWQRYVAGTVIGPVNTGLDHYVLAYAYEQMPDGSYVYRIRNSWGAGWGESGDCVVNEAALEQFGDVIALSVRRA